MPKMTIVWLLIYFGSWALSFVNPLFGLLGYLFEYYLRPALHWWGLWLPDLRWNLAISIVLVATYLLRRDSLPELPALRNPALKWILGLAAVMLLVTPFAADVTGSFDKAVQFQKIVVIYLLIAAIVRSRRAFDAVAAVHIAGAAWWGWEQTWDPRREASRLMHVGSADTLNDNLAAAHLLTVLPFIFVYLFTTREKWLRGLALFAAPFVVNLFILCNSRGGTIGLVAGGFAALVLAKPGHRLRLMGAIPVVAVVFLFLADPEFIARQQTTMDYENESTALERMESWRGGLALILDNPFGTGGNGYELLYGTYAPALAERYGGAGRAPHNTYVLVTAEWGLLGLLMFLGLTASTLLMLRRIRRQSGPDDGDYYRSFALTVGLVATLTASMFADRLYGESFYWMCGLAIALYRISHATSDAREGAARDSAARDAAAPSRPAPPVRRPLPVPSWRGGYAQTLVSAPGVFPPAGARKGRVGGDT